MNSTIDIPEDLPKSSHDQVLDIVLKEDDLNWKDLVMDLVRKENMDPWDIDVSLLAKKFLQMIKEIKETDFRVTGKMVLAASLLLKIKSDRLLIDDLANFDALINGPEDEFLDEDFDIEKVSLEDFLNDNKKLVPRTPQPRQRKVSVFDLVDALEQALDQDTKRRRALILRQQSEEVDVTIAKKVFNLAETMDGLQNQLKRLFTKKKTKVMFHDLVTGPDKQDKVFTFLPLLHLENQQKVHLDQEDHFGDIEVTLYNKKLLEKKLTAIEKAELAAEEERKANKKKNKRSKK